MELALKGRRALVTGSSQGIGTGVAEMLAAEGATVAVHGRDEARATEVADRIAAAGGEVEVVLGDLADAEGCDHVARDAEAKLGGVDILVNNAGGVVMSGGERFATIGGKAENPWFEPDWDAWSGTYEQNVGSTVRLIHALVPGMRERGWGRIVNLGSVAASTALVEIPNYAAAKAAITNLTVSLTRALTGTGITVNTITPTMIRTPVLEGWFASLGEQYGWGDTFEEVEKHVVSELHELSVPFAGEPSDIAAMVCVLASQHGRFITGANFRIDGGFSRHPN